MTFSTAAILFLISMTGLIFSGMLIRSKPLRITIRVLFAVISAALAVYMLLTILFVESIP